MTHTKRMIDADVLLEKLSKYPDKVYYTKEISNIIEYIIHVDKIEKFSYEKNTELKELLKKIQNKKILQSYKIAPENIEDLPILIDKGLEHYLDSVLSIISSELQRIIDRNAKTNELATPAPEPQESIFDSDDDNFTTKHPW